MKWLSYIFFSLFFLMTDCVEKKDPPKDQEILTEQAVSKPEISRVVYHDKVLGLLVGSAIGDAMGAPTEMWDRRDIELDYGFVEGLDSMVRSPTAEGTWKYNLPAGGTTDDTRWKKLTFDYLLEVGINQADPESFAEYITRLYKERIQVLKETDAFEPEPFEDNLMKMTWLQEWAMVAKPYSENDFRAYSNALNKFYGGEMTCAGMLYSPVFGATSPKNPLAAYKAGYEMSIFDIGYAKDMTALVSSMVAAAFNEQATVESVLNVNRIIDPEGYFKSRLVGRSAYRFYQNAKNIKFETDKLALSEFEILPEIPHSMKHLDVLEYLRLTKAFDMLDQANEDVAFHPGEIYLITLTALMFCEFDFEKSMTFIVNYGRDNDTVAAIAGAILGAYWGTEKLPVKMSEQVIQINRNELGIDLEELANQMTDHFFN